MKFELQEIARALGSPINPEWSGRVAEGWSIDSRTIQAGDIFFALRGPNHDGHDWVKDVLRKGASAAVVDKGIVDKELVAGEFPDQTNVVDHLADGSLRLLRVGDTLDALQELAAWARSRFRGHVIAVTGSAGKTTTKDVIAQMLAVRMATAKNEGNLNNHIGLPLSLLRLNESAQVAVLEMGMNHAGEIQRLAEIARPAVGVVTNVGFAHLENFTSIEGIAAAKRELIEALSESGTAVLNADDVRVTAFAKAHTGRTILYGQAQIADVRAEEVRESPAGVSFRVGATEFNTRLHGRHNVSNILAGIAVAGIYGISPNELTSTVAALSSGKMRGERLIHDGVTVFNDCYNSNPEATRAMLDLLSDSPAQKRIAVLGEMLELGHASQALHREIGIYAASRGIDVLIGIQGGAREMVAASGLRHAYYFDDPDAAGRFVRGLAHKGDAILFKGSRGVRVERALARFLADENPPDGNSGGAA